MPLAQVVDRRVRDLREALPEVASRAAARARRAAASAVSSPIDETSARGRCAAIGRRTDDQLLAGVAGSDLPRA